MRMLLFLLLLAGATAAQAQLYRWIDPESGSVKYSSYPPPWYGDPARERRAPKVEVIPAGKPPPAQVGDVDTPPAGLGASLNELAVRRRAMLAEISGALSAGTTISPALQKRVEDFTALSEQLDRADPAGAAARLAEVQTAMQGAARGSAK